MPKELHFTLHPLAFRSFSVESRLTQGLQYPGDMLHVILNRGGMEKDVIHVYRGEVLSTLHNMVHHPLERRGGIHQSKWKHRLFEVIGPTDGDRGDESCQGYGFSSHGYLIIPLL